MRAMLGALLLATLASSMSTADPLHQFGNQGAWRHEFSGWQFAKQVGGFSRELAPYTIDGNDDVGVGYEYASDGTRLSAVVEIYLANSAAADATFEGAKASAARKAGDSARVQSERPFRVEAHEVLPGTKVTYAVDDKPAGAQTSLYFFEARRWKVKVLGSTDAPSEETDKLLDAFVQALPWESLGDPTALH